MALLPFSTVRWAGALALGAGVLGVLPGPAQAAPDGRQISTQGANGAPACMTCHGANGEGNPAAGFPHLAGMGERTRRAAGHRPWFPAAIGTLSAIGGVFA